ncbi:MAG TPA: hypothetical protein VMP03_13550 [Methylomirabilota bacterium]|nr:hypothetical protein [Methylomirabilota bacterium]
MAKLCLNMIVRNDAATLRRSLESTAGAIDAWVIADAGSTDGSAEIVREVFAARGVPGQLVEVPFQSFAQARNAALDACRRSHLAFDFILLGDAEMDLRVTDRNFRDGLSRDSHSVLHQVGASFHNRRILRRDAGGAFRGVTHEYLDMAGPAPLLEGLVIRQFAGSSRSGPARAELDARLLTEGLKVEQDPLMRARYTFYLGNACRALGDKIAARRHYLDRARLGFWEEEIYCARLYAARLGEQLGLPIADVLAEFAALNNEMTHRAEAMHAVARICRMNGWWEQAYATALAATEIEKPRDALFLEDWIYDYGVIDELAIAAFRTGRFAESLQLSQVLLVGGLLPASQIKRVTQNAELAADALDGVVTHA